MNYSNKIYQHNSPGKATTAFFQPKLTINNPNDKFENEADAVADKVMQMEITSLQKKSGIDSFFSSSPVLITPLQRKCDNCKAEEKMHRKEIDTEETAADNNLENYVGGLHSGGQPLSNEARSFYEPRFGYDFSNVKVHTDTVAAKSAQSINALAYTSGNNIVFNNAQFSPNTDSGKKLLGHELTHVVQQGSDNKIQRQSDGSEDDPILTSKNRVDELKIIVESKLQDTIELKTLLEPASSPENDIIREQLSVNREEMILLLEERVDLLTYLLGLRDECDDETALLEEEFILTVQWLFPLKRWKKRNEIEHINLRIAEINLEIAQFAECNDETEVLYSEIERLIRNKKSLARELSSTAIEYKQFDSRWGKVRYGSDSTCTTIAEAACGPASLAMVLNFYELENPEGIAKTGVTEIILPSETADYAKEHGRVCNQGTNGNEMMKGVSGKWEDYRGKAIKLSEVIGELENGRLVIFLCKNCVGNNAKGQSKTYGGHYMVLIGVNDTLDKFKVLDSGRKEENNIETIDLNNLKTKVTGFWTVESAE